MIIIKDGHDLSLVNPVRMNEQALSDLDALGVVRHVIRLGDFHGLDDQFYVDRYRAQFWCQDGQRTYQNPLPDHLVSTSTVPPMPAAAFFIFENAKYPEAALLLKEHKLLITTDSVQFWADWDYTTAFTRLMLWLMGFRLKLLIGGPWLKRVTPRGSSLLPDFERLMALDFEHLVAAHGKLLRHGAKPLLEAVIGETFDQATKSYLSSRATCG